MSFNEKTSSAARGKWKGILMHLGIPDSFLKKENGPCPFCKGGKDRFRFTDLDGAGTWYCSQCDGGVGGAGMEMVMRFTGLGFAEAARRVDDILGNVKPDSVRIRSKPTPEEQRAACTAVWRETVKSVPGDLIHRYLAARGIDMEVPPNIRLHPALRDGAGGIRPAMVARVTAADGTGATLHRTFLKSDGSGKAEMDAPRKLMAGDVPSGAAIRLGPERATMGIAEGIETALAASALFDVPVWAAVSAQMMEKWTPPEIAEDITIFGDSDENFAGQSAAYSLANRIKITRPEVVVTVKLPPRIGTDWNDCVQPTPRTGATP